MGDVFLGLCGKNEWQGEKGGFVGHGRPRAGWVGGRGKGAMVNGVVRQRALRPEKKGGLGLTLAIKAR